MIKPGFASSKWEALHRDKSGVLQRAERAAKVTLPAVFPLEGHTENSHLPAPYQGLGARAVNTLSAKITLALFPPNTTFFRIGFDEVTKSLLEGNDRLEEIQKNISLLEQIIVTELEQTRLRSILNEAVRHLIIAGNGAIECDRDGNFRFHGLRSYCVQRDPQSHLLFFILKETVAFETIDEKIIEELKATDPSFRGPTDPTDDVDIFTVMQRKDNKFEVWQEINNTQIESTKATYPLDAPPFIVVRWSNLPDENYGRGLVDDYYADFAAMDDLSRDMLDASAISAKVILTVDPNGVLTSRKLRDSKAGDVLDGDADSVKAITVDKMGDFNVVIQRIETISEEIRKAFLMHSSVTRNAERVTAEEIRFMASELEDALGGVYSLLGHDLQAPLLRRYIKVLGRQKKIPDIPGDEMALKITTGIEALGRSHEVMKLVTFVQQARELLGPELLAQRVNPGAVLHALAAGLGVAADNLVMSDEEVAAQQQQMAMQQMAQQAAPGMAQEAMRQQGAQ